MSQQGKIIFVTGASSGIGKATALYLANQGVKAIALMARRQEPLDAVAKEIEAAHPNVKTLVVVGDVSVPADNERAVKATVVAFGGLNGAFVNAGRYSGGSKLHEVTDEVVDNLINVNAKSIIYALRYLIPAIQATVGDDGQQGSIVVNSSCMGTAVIGPKSAGSGVYAATKAFVNSLVETAAIENAPKIRVNSVMPGLVQTAIMPVDHDTYQAMGAALQPLWGKPGQPEEIASLVNFLLSDEASFISGTNVKADGLWSLSGGRM